MGADRFLVGVVFYRIDVFWGGIVGFGGGM